MFLDVTPTPLITHANRAEYNQERGFRNPFLLVGHLYDLGYQVTVGNNAKSPGLLVPTRGR